MKNMRIADIASEKINICARTTSERNPLSLVWSGSFVEFVVKASEFRILVAGPYSVYENWIAIEINGEILSRRMLSKDKEWITVFRMMNPEKQTHVRIIKETQAFESDTEHRLDVYEIETDGELLPVDFSDRLKIEFIGDSITSAEGCIGARCEEDWIAQIFSHTNSYPYMVGKKLDADVRVFSQSGWGVYSSWDCKESGAIPLYYEDIYSLMSYNPANKDSFFAINGYYENWDFLKWQPDVIVINLGTNDDGAFHNNECDNHNLLRMQGTEFNEEDRLKVRTACIDFLRVVRKCNPDAQIFWAFGIFPCDIADTIKEAVELYVRGQADGRVAYLELPKLTEDTVGARFHPGKKAHKKAAKALVQAIKDEIIKKGL